MKKLLSVLTIMVLLIGCTVDTSQFNQEYNDFVTEYKLKRENIRTSVQYDSLKTWAKGAAGVLVTKYLKAEFSDTLLAKYADIMAYAGKDMEAAAAFAKSFTLIEKPDAKYVARYFDLKMEDDLKDASVREVIEKDLEKYKEVLGEKWVQKVLYYGYHLSEKGLTSDATVAFTKVVEADAGKSMTGQAVQEIANITYENEGIEKAIDYLKSQKEANPENKMVAEKLVQFGLIGKKAPELTKVYSLGDSKSLKDLRGKVVMVDYWAPWCGPCRKAFPEMKDLYSEFKDKDFEIVGATNYYPFYRDEKENIQNISQEEYNKKLEEFKARHELPWPFVVAEDKVNRNNYGVSFIPTFFLIDKKGIIRYAQVGTKEDPEFLKKKIKELL